MTDTPNSNPSKPDWAKSKRELKREANPGASSKTKWFVLVGVIVIAAGVIGVAMKGSPSEDLAADPIVLENNSAKYISSAELSRVDLTLLQKQIKVTGTVQPLHVAQIPSLISAQVESVTFRVGDSVNKGQVVVKMDTESLEIQKEQQLSATYATQTQLKLAESQLKRTSELAEQGIATSSLLEEVQSNVEAMKANLTSQQAQIKSVDYSLRNAVISAPISGVVSTRNVEPGQFIGVGSPLLEIVDLSVMELKVNVSTSNNGLVKKGMKVSISVEGLDNQTFSGVISRISPVASVGTRTIPIYILIDNVDRKLRGGMFAIGQITLAEKTDAIAVENSALQTDAEGRSFVFKVVDNKVVKQFVELGDVWGASQYHEVVSGLEVGDQYVNVLLAGLDENDELHLIGN